MRIAAVAALAIALARPVIDRSVSMTWLTIGMIVAFGVALLAMASIALARGLNRSVSYSLAGAAALALLVGIVWAGYAYASGPTLSVDEATPTAIAIVMDNGPTSAWIASNDDRLGRMKEIANWMVTRVPRTSRIAVVDRSSQPIAFSLDAASALSKIDQTRTLQVTQPIASRIENAARLLQTSELTNRQIFVVTDLARSTWADSESSGGLMVALRESPAIAVHVFDLGDFDASNRTLSLPNVTDLTPAKGVPIPVSTTLRYQVPRNQSEPEPTEQQSDGELTVTAEMQLYASDPTLPVIRDGKIQRPALRNVDRVSVQVAPDTSHELLLTIPPLEVGTHHGVIRLIGDDAMALDDSCYFTVDVLPPSKVLLVATEQNEAKTIGATITAPLDWDDPAAEFLLPRIDPTDLPVVELDDFKAIILLDPPRELLQDDALVQYVQSGGGLLVCLGKSSGDESLADSGLVKLVRRWRIPTPGTFFQIVQPSHPAMSAIVGTPGGIPWNDYRVNQYWEIESNDSSVDTVLIRYAGTDHPALVERRFSPANEDEDKVAGQRDAGRCLIVTTQVPDLSAADARWNDLYGSEAWPAFVLVRQLADFIARRGGQGTTGLVGTPHVSPLMQQIANVSNATASRDEADPSGDETRRLQLFPPADAAPIPINLEPNQNQIVIRDVPTAGTWWLRGDRPGAGFSVNLPRDRISTDRIEAVSLDSWFGAEGYTVVTHRDEVELAEAESSTSVLLHSPAMLFALVVFLLEQILSNRFYPARGESPASLSSRVSPPATGGVTTT